MKRIVSGVLLGLVLTFTNTAAFAQDEAAESPWSANTTVSLFSKYMFRGIKLYDAPGFQPSASVGYDGGELGALEGLVWAHVPTEGADVYGTNYNEIDYVLTYSQTFDDWINVSVGNAWYTYAGGEEPDSTNEFQAIVAFDTLLSPVVSFFNDYDEYQYQYYELGLSHTLTWEALGDGFNITPFVSFGFASNAVTHEAYADNGFVQATYGASFEASLGDLALVPTVAYTKGNDGFASDELWWGFSLSKDF